jgi:hypothetical protein
MEDYIAIWSILRLFGVSCDHLVYFTVIWYIFPVLVCCTKKNLATLVRVAVYRGRVCRDTKSG